ncbi:hypothetical protein JST99_00885 [Candidatus Dependentiae bacterium]|nr:hypothetical protein [Candidatus Dependentiae bacterium]MCC7415334.1 hypothetical protein [Campylobacterota bacterium]
MKSIVEQASTVLKAIEKGWEQAGKPAEFTIKVYEHGVKNFFGMSIEPAKICILFEDKSSKAAHQKQHPRHEASSQQQSHHSAGHQQPRKDTAGSSEQRRQTNQHQQRLQKPALANPVAQSQIKKEPSIERPAQPVSTKIMWDDELINACNAWLTGTLGVMGKSNCTFKVDAKKYHLIITFDQAVLEDKEREKALFRSFAHILMQSLRNRFKKGLRGYRIVLNAQD